VAEHREIFAAVQGGYIEEAVEKLTANLRTTERLLTETYETLPQRIDQLLPLEYASTRIAKGSVERRPGGRAFSSNEPLGR
jgi:hypothetical protein